MKKSQARIKLSQNYSGPATHPVTLQKKSESAEYEKKSSQDKTESEFFWTCHSSSHTAKKKIRKKSPVRNKKNPHSVPEEVVSSTQKKAKFGKSNWHFI